jgi:ferritin-like metal-binding protein YciE
MSKQRETLQKYVGDMLSVERHIYDAISHQKDDADFKNFPEAQAFVTKTETLLGSHISKLESHLKSLGGSPSKPVKEAVASVLGKAAGVIDNVRQNDKISTDLRDDYTALNLAAMSYTMLHTTGLALQDPQTAELARTHLMDLTPLITRLNEIMPEVVARELKDEGENVDASVGKQAIQNTQRAWTHEHVHAGHADVWSI